MLRKLHLHKFSEIFVIKISTVQLSDAARRRYRTIAPLCQRFTVFTMHINTKKDRTKTLAKFPEHISIDCAF